MTTGGVSIKGTYHEQNQDRFWTCSDSNNVVIAISDGLGSCKLSAVGSQAFCDSAKDVLLNENLTPSDTQALCAELHEQWLEHLVGYSVSDCYATALFAVLRDGILTMGALGDGFIAALFDNGEPLILWDDKEDHFINETDCLNEQFVYSDWRVVCLPCNNLTGLIGSTDGMELYPAGKATIETFINGFFDSYKRMSSQDINTDIKVWLNSWPGADDKTVAYCLKGDCANG